MPNETAELFSLAAKHFLKEYKARGGSQTGLARDLGISRAYLSSVMSGSRSASFDLYTQIAEKLHGPLDKFLAVGRRIREGRPPLEDERDQRDDAEHLIARLTYYILDHRRIENEIKELKHFYESIVENLQSGVLVMDEKNKVIFANRQIKNICGVTQDEVMGRSPFNFERAIPGLSIYPFVQKYQAAYEQLEPLYYENINFRTPQGESRYASGWLIPMLQGETFQGMICTLRDTTGSHALFSLLTETVEHVHEAVIILQLKRPGTTPTAFFANRKFRNLLGLEDIDPFSLPFEDVVRIIGRSIQDKDAWEHCVRRAIEENSTESTCVLEHSNGRKYFARATPVHDRQGVLIGKMVLLKEMI
ncbi:MAG: hypothetical protein Kow0089_21550 [Desulfobulbaceae bacterium]